MMFRRWLYRLKTLKVTYKRDQIAKGSRSHQFRVSTFWGKKIRHRVT